MNSTKKFVLPISAATNKIREDIDFFAFPEDGTFGSFEVVAVSGMIMFWVSAAILKISSRMSVSTSRARSSFPKGGFIQLSNPLRISSISSRSTTLIHEDIVKMAAETENIIRPPTAITSKDPKVPSLGNAKKSTSSRILFVIAEIGNTNFLVELIHLYPDLSWKVNDNNQTIFHIVVEHRHERIYNILYEVGLVKELITPLRDGNDNNMLHLVGKMTKKSYQDVGRLALQMQRELLWYKEVQSMIPPYCREYKDLVTQAEKWMKDMSKNEIDDILRGLRDRIKPPFGNDDQAPEVPTLIHDDIVKMPAEPRT
ncbi:hypothetical protein L6452_39431 [Arctium lappa]|uniref:Uncharacterized protein n=1 Tax=Arctium lappa TaxID=4217 RepID=A0ACB8XSV3_ARCLA|nr:hypothetical protein L6452_39431 [Arctium lappa]